MNLQHYSIVRVESVRWNSSVQYVYIYMDICHGILAVKPQEPQDEISPAFSTVHFNDQFSFRCNGSPEPAPLCAPNAAVFLQLNRIFAQLQFSHFPIAPNQVVKIFIWANRFLMVCHFN